MEFLFIILALFVGVGVGWLFLGKTEFVLVPPDVAPKSTGRDLKGLSDEELIVEGQGLMHEKDDLRAKQLDVQLEMTRRRGEWAEKRGLDALNTAEKRARQERH